MRLRTALPFVSAALVYAAIFAAWTYPLITRASSHSVLHAEAASAAFKRNDQLLCISGAARNADAILAGDLRRLIDNQVCHPLPLAATLGEHLIETGLLALPVYSVSRNPVLAYNSAVLASFVLAGLSMLALVLHLTGSWIAGFAAGLLFAFHPIRAAEIGHLHVIGLHWLPLVLLFFDRLLRFGRARDAALLAGAASLQGLVGSYPMLVLVGFALPFGAVRLMQLRAQLDRRRIALLAGAVVVTCLVAALVLLPYSLAAAEWQDLKRRPSHLIPLASYLPGGINALGLAAPLLAALLIGIRRRTGGSAAAALLAGTLTCALLSAYGPLWPGGPALPALYPWLADHVFVLGTVRAPASLRLGAHLGVAALAGLGLAALIERLGTRLPRPQRIGGVALMLVAAELFQPSLRARIYGGALGLAVERRAPPDEILQVYRAFDLRELPGPIVELPHPADQSMMFSMPGHLLLAGYHLRPTTACFNSHMPASYHSVARLVSRLPEPRALSELAAAGMRNLVLWTGPQDTRTRVIAAELAGRPGAQVVYRSPQATGIRLGQVEALHDDPSLLRPLGASLRDHLFQGYTRHLLDLEIENTGSAIFVLPQPIAAQPAILRWLDAGQLREELALRLLLPLALAGHARDRLEIDIGEPPRDCARCVPELELPNLGWRVRPGGDAETGAS